MSPFSSDTQEVGPKRLGTEYVSKNKLLQASNLHAIQKWYTKKKLWYKF